MIRVGLRSLCLALVLPVWLACRQGGTISGRVAVPGSRSPVLCRVEINSATSPFYAPVLLEVESGEEFEWAFSGQLEDVYVAARCDGYPVAVVSRRNGGGIGSVDLGDIVVRHEPGKAP